MAVYEPPRISDKHEFGKVWAWTALSIFLAVMILAVGDGMVADLGGLLAWTLLAAFAAFFPGAGIACLVHGFVNTGSD